MISGQTVRCDYCHRPATRTTGRELYRGHRPDLNERIFWVCVPCDARVGCHPGTERPLGGLANAELRKARNAAHAAFDPLWQSGGMRRHEAYAWLAKQMKRKTVHVAESDLEACALIVDLCTRHRQKIARTAARAKAAPTAA